MGLDQLGKALLPSGHAGRGAAKKMGIFIRVKIKGLFHSGISGEGGCLRSKIWVLLLVTVVSWPMVMLMDEGSAAVLCCSGCSWWFNLYFCLWGGSSPLSA